MNSFIKELKQYRHILPKQTISTLRGQAISGNVEGAEKGLKTAIKKANVMDMAHRSTKITLKHFNDNKDIKYKGQLQCGLKVGHEIKQTVSRK